MDTKIKPIINKENPKLKKIVSKEQAVHVNLDFGMIKRNEMTSKELRDNTLKYRVNNSYGIRRYNRPNEEISQLNEEALPFKYTDPAIMCIYGTCTCGGCIW